MFKLVALVELVAYRLKKYFLEFTQHVIIFKPDDSPITMRLKFYDHDVKPQKKKQTGQ